MTDNKIIRFYTSGLLSKWGFKDGDILSEECDSILFGKDSEHKLLDLIVREKILPALKHEVTYIFVETNHNPCRVQTVDGILVDWYSEEYHPLLTPAYIELTEQEIIDLDLKHANNNNHENGIIKEEKR